MVIISLRRQNRKISKRRHVKKSKGCLGMKCLGDGVKKFTDFLSVSPCVCEALQITRALSNIVQLSKAKKIGHDFHISNV